MLPAKFLNSPEGQLYLLRKRREKRLHFIFDIDPKGYGESSKDDKKAFSQYVVKEMKERRRKSFRSDLALKMSIETSASKPLPIQRYPKTYIDLLHQKYHRDNKGYVARTDWDRLPMRDDSQIKFLSVDIHVSKINSLRVRIDKLDHLVQDLAFLESIASPGVNDDTDSCHEFDPTFNPDEFHDLLGDKAYVAMQYMHESDRQGSLLKATDFQFHMFEILLSGHTRNERSLYSVHNDIYSTLRSNILNFPSCVHLGSPPSSKKRNDQFNKSVKDAIEIELSKYKLKNRLLHPIRCTILVIQPERSKRGGNIKDLDNYAFRNILPIIHNVLNPQVTLEAIYYDTYPLADDIKEPQRLNDLPKSVVQYTILEIPRLEDDPKEGSVFMFLGKETFHDCYWEELDNKIGQALDDDEFY